MSSINHRCEGSLKHGVSIRYSKKYHNIKTEDDFRTWRLFKAEWTDSWDSKYLNPISPIKYCPFCGEKLIKS